MAENNCKIIFKTRDSDVKPFLKTEIDIILETINNDEDLIDEACKIIRKIKSNDEKQLKRFENTKNRLTGIKREQKEFLIDRFKAAYEKIDEDDLGDFRGKLFEKVIESYILKNKEKLELDKNIYFGAAIVEFENGKFLKFSCKKRIQRSIELLQEKIELEKTKINSREYTKKLAEIEKENKENKTERSTADVIVARKGSIYLTELKVAPYGFDCLTLNNLINMKEYIMKHSYNAEIICLSTDTINNLEVQIRREYKENDTCKIDCIKDNREDFLNKFIIWDLRKLESYCNI